jgi:hypothetical protein
MTKIRPGMAEIQAKRCGHRVDRVLSFLYDRPNWDSPPHPLARRQVCTPPPPQFQWEGTLACGRGGGGSQFQRGDRHCGTLGIHVLCACGRCFPPSYKVYPYGNFREQKATATRFVMYLCHPWTDFSHFFNFEDPNTIF